MPHAAHAAHPLRHTSAAAAHPGRGDSGGGELWGGTYWRLLPLGSPFLAACGGPRLRPFSITSRKSARCD